MTSTTTCNYTTPQDRTGDPPSASQVWNYASSSCVTNNDLRTLNGFSYGDILIAFFLFVLVAGQFFGGIMNRIVGVKQKKK